MFYIHTPIISMEAYSFVIHDSFSHLSSFMIAKFFRFHFHPRCGGYFQFEIYDLGILLGKGFFFGLINYIRFLGISQKMGNHAVVP